MNIFFLAVSFCLALAQTVTYEPTLASPTSEPTTETPELTLSPETPTSAPTLSPATTSAPTHSPSREDCKEDIATFCPTEEGFQRCQCLKDHVDELSPNCAAFVRAKAAAREQAQTACGRDARKLCSRYLENRDYSLLGGCLVANSEQLSQECKAFVQRKISEIPSNACDADVSTLCSNSTGFSAQFTCLNSQMQNVSENCRKLMIISAPKEMFQSGRNKHHGKHHGKHHDKHSRTARKMCGDDAKQFCSSEFENGREAIRACLYDHYSDLSEKCSSFLDARANGEYSDEGEDGYHHHRGVRGGVIVGVVVVAVLTLICCRKRCKRRCRERRMMWEQYRLMQMGQMGQMGAPMQPNMQMQQPTQMVAVPVQAGPTTSQQTSQSPSQQTVMYAAAPYTGNPYSNQLLSASPMAYNP